ncbi:Hypothetical predicted protein, partial [Mytilus galloprovincialis]
NDVRKGGNRKEISSNEGKKPERLVFPVYLTLTQLQLHSCQNIQISRRNQQPKSETLRCIILDGKQMSPKSVIKNQPDDVSLLECCRFGIRYAGGGYFDQPGSAAEYVCLPPDPDFVKTSAFDNGRMYGAEFDANFFASNADKEDVPCALCRPKHSASTIMIPGKNTCYSGWKLEYHGYLASGYFNHKAASSFVCVDINPEYIIGGLDMHYGKLFYEVVAKCGSLKCPPYMPNYPLTCVVCTK